MVIHVIHSNATVYVSNLYFCLPPSLARWPTCSLSLSLSHSQAPRYPTVDLTNYQYYHVLSYIRRPRPSPRPGRRLGPPQVWNFSARAFNVRGSFHQAWPSAFAAPGLQPALCLHIPRGSFLHIPRGSFHQAPGRQRSSIAACPLPAHSRLLLGPSSLPFARLQTPKTPKTP